VQAALGRFRRFRLRARLERTITPSPAPATSNRTGGFPASGSPRRRPPPGLCFRPPGRRLSRLRAPTAPLPAGGGFRPAVYLHSRLLRTDGGSCHPTPASPLFPNASSRAPSLHGHYPASPLLRTHLSGSRLHHASPPRLARLPCFRGLSPRGGEPFPVSTHGRMGVPPPSTPPDGPPQGRLRGSPAAFAASESARHPELTSHEASSGCSLVVAARSLAHPAFRGFVGGLHRRGLPYRCHPSYAVSTFYRFGTFTLWVHG
jgi:hypothetical protein